MDGENEEILKQDPFRVDIEELRAINERFSHMYGAIRSTSELDSQSTLTLLSSLVLIGVSLASRKPDEVQVLGFTIQAEHWLVLAIPLLLVVVYASTQLLIVWYTERMCLSLAIARLTEFVHAENRRLSRRVEDRATATLEEGHRRVKAADEIWAWYDSAWRAARVRHEEEFNRVSFDEWYDEQGQGRRSKELDDLESQMKAKLREAGADYESGEFGRRLVMGERSGEEVLSKYINDHLAILSRLLRLRITLGFYVPLIVAGLAIATLTIAAVAPSLLGTLSVPAGFTEPS